MTSRAVTASMCASASDVALFVASLMPFLPGYWTRLIVARNTRKRWLESYAEHPASMTAPRVPTRRRSTVPKIGWQCGTNWARLCWSCDRLPVTFRRTRANSRDIRLRPEGWPAPEAFNMPLRSVRPQNPSRLLSTRLNSSSTI